MPIVKKIRTGFGFDSHLFSRRGTLALGGLPFKGTPALAGHSDGDAVLHAVIDALLGAAALGDIGDMFPDSSKKIKGISSRVLLQRALLRVRAAGFLPEHVDVTVVANKPRLGSLKLKMKNSLARDLKLPASSVNVKAKTQEGLTWFDSPGGIAVWAVATLASL